VKKALLVGLLLWGSQAEARIEWSLYPHVEFFRWEEFRDTGERLLEEEGVLFGAGGAFRFESERSPLLLQAKAELFVGEVDYRGRTQPSLDPATNELPVDTEGRYVGTKFEGDVGFRLGRSAFAVEPLVGLGYRWWVRDLGSSTTVDRNGRRIAVGGASEFWQTFYGYLGARAEYAWAPRAALHARLTAKYPLQTFNRADVFGDHVTVEPESRWSAYLELGLRYGRFRPTLFYEGFHFGESDPEQSGAFLVRQPESKSEIIGLNLGIIFP
jgi:hypothetical protein